MAFSPDDLRSFLVGSEMELYIGKSLELAAAFRGEESIAAGGNRLTKNSSEARVVLDDLYILEEKNKKGSYKTMIGTEEKPKSYLIL
jgi:hypothetical protein